MGSAGGSGRRDRPDGVQQSSGRTPLAMAADAARAALDDAGLRPSDVDGIIDFSTGDSASGPGDRRGRPGAAERAVTFRRAASLRP